MSEKKWKEEILLEAMEAIDDSYIESAGKRLLQGEQIPERKPEPAGATGGKAVAGWKKWAALAACLCIVLGGAGLLGGGQEGKVPQDGNPGNVQNPVMEHPVYGSDTEGETQEPKYVNGLPVLTVNLGSAAYGFEGYLLYDITEMDTGNPWKENMEIETLPVFRNASCHPAGVPFGLSEEDLAGTIERIGKALGVEFADIEYEITEADGILTEDVVSRAEASADGVKIFANADGTTRIEFAEPVKLPEECSFGWYNISVQDAEKTLQYLTSEYSQLTGFTNPRPVTSVQYDIYADILNHYGAYEDGADMESKMLNYTFCEASFGPDDEGNLGSIWLTDRLAVAEKLGDYPLISMDEARRLLLEGNYVTSVPYEMPGEEYIGKVELMYRSGATEETWMPYYRFFVEVPEEYREDTGLKTYGAYYVPAVEETYIENMPIYDGRFN